MTDEMNNNSDAAASPLTTAAHDVLLERHRQKEIEGWSVEHDDLHDSGQMARAAACYAVGAKIERRVYSTFRFSQPNFMSLWPWDDQWWKPKDRRRDLVRAAALILAEIERLDRAMATKGTLLRPNPNHSGGPMTRSEPPAEVIENVLRMLRESARWHDEENRPYSAGVERDAIALIESLRASSSLGGIEGGVARAEDSAPHPDERFMEGQQAWQPIETAPKDDPDFQALGCKPDPQGGWHYFLLNRHDIGGRYECWTCPPGRPVSPTHWTPLPEAPK